MIFSEEFFGQLPWYFLIGAVGLAIAWWWLKKTSKLQNGLFLAGIIILLGCALRIGNLGSRVIIVRFSKLDAPVERRTGKFLFSVNYVFQNGSKATLHQLLPESDLGAVLVNDSPETLRLILVPYATTSMTALPKSAPTLIPPMSTFTLTVPADEIGPDQTPPDTMESSIGLGVRTWLTWGPKSDSE
jgi:hypothetical protein